MDKNDIQKHLTKLLELDKKINPKDSSEVDLNNDFVVELDEVLTALGRDMEKELGKKVQNPPTMDIRFKKLDPNAVTPTYAKEGDAGLDLTATVIRSNTSFNIQYGTGLAFEIPRGYVGLIFPRSSIQNYELELANSVGVLDSGYRGEIKLMFNKLNGIDSVKYKIGDRIAQMVIIPYPEIKLVESDDLTKTERNEGGFGHSGK